MSDSLGLILDGRLWLKGSVIGFSIAAPVGPIGVLCIRRSLANGIVSGLLTGLGAATADALYGAIAGFGFTAVTRWLIAERPVLSVLGGVYLCYLGLRSLRPKTGDAPMPPATTTSHFAAYASTLLLTLTNPMTILSFVAIFAGLGITVTADWARAASFVLGVFAGSALWWLALSGTVAALRRTLSLGFISGINAVAGVIVTIFGLYAISRGFR